MRIPAENIDHWKSLLMEKDDKGASDYYFETVLPKLVTILEKRESHNHQAGQTDVLISLLGFSPETVVIIASILKPKKIVVIYSKNVTKYYDRLAEFLFSNRIISYSGLVHVIVDPTDPVDIYKAISEHREVNKNVIVDVTGGKKVMSATAAQAAWEWDLRLCYLESPSYDPIIRRPIPGDEKLIILPNPSTQKARNQRARASELYHRGLYYEAKESFEASKTRNPDNSFDELGFRLSSVYYAWTNLDLSLLQRELISFIQELKSPRLKAQVHSHDEVQVSINALEKVTQRDTVALMGTMLMLAEHYQELGRFDFASLFAYRAMEYFVREKLCQLIDPEFNMLTPDYSPLVECDVIAHRYHEVEASLQRKAIPKGADLPTTLEFIRGLNLICAIDPTVSESVFPNMLPKSLIGKYMGCAKLRNQSILAHGTITLTKEHCQSLIADAQLLGRGLLQSKFTEVEEFKTLIKAPRLPTV